MSDRSEAATTVTVSYPADLSEWGREAVEGTSFRRYLGKVHETATVGDIWEEFVGVGCCGDTLDVPLRVEAIEGPGSASSGGERPEGADGSEGTDGFEGTDGTEERTYAIDEETTFAFEERAECTGGGGWEVQSHAGP